MALIVDRVGFEPGHVKTGGRQKGTPNRGPSLRRLFQSNGLEAGDLLIEFLKPSGEAAKKRSKADERARVVVICKLLPYLFVKPNGDTPEYPDELNELSDQELAGLLLKFETAAKGPAPAAEPKKLKKKKARK